MGKGNIIGKSNEPTASVASGVWTLQEQLLYKKQNLWPSVVVATDPFLSSVQLLLHGDTNFSDYSNNLTTVSVSGNATNSTSVYKYGTGSMNFTSAGSYAKFPNSNLTFGTGDWTIELWWYQPASVPAYGVIFDVDTTSNFFVGFSASTTGLRIYSAGNGVDYNPTHSMTAGNWYHLAWVRNGSTITIYQNGTSIGSVAAGSATYSPSGSSPNAFINTYGASLGNYQASGHIDEFRITKGVARYTANFTPPTAVFPDSGNSGTTVYGDPYFANVLALWHADGTNGSTTFTDSSSSARATTAVNTSINTTTKKFGTGSMYFGTGNNGYLSLNTELTITGNYTVEFWAYLTGISPSGYSIGFGATSVNSQFPTMQNSGVIGYYNNGASFNSASGKFSLNTWFHCAIVRSSNTVKIYIDGVDTGSSTTDSGTLYIKNVSGYSGGGSGYNVLGYFDDIRISNIARYTSNFTPPTAAFPDSA